MGRKHGRRRHRERADFWRKWRDERRRTCSEGAGWGPGGPPHLAEAIHSWREFFHGFMGAWPEHHWIFRGRRFKPWREGLDAFNPFIASLLSKGGGLLPLYVLHLLSQEPRYGNEIMALIAQRTGGGWLANPGAIYPLMNLLEAEGLVKGQWEDPHKRTVRIYSLTDAGSQELTRLKAVIRPKLQEAIEVLQELASEMGNGEPEGSGPSEVPEVEEGGSA